MLSLINKKIKVAVHDGIFHTDDVFSVAILSLYLNKPLKIFRTRDPKIFAKMDYLLDVGREYNPKDNKFDHHQEDWNEKRENGIPYATSGLLWKEYGEKITNSKEAANKIDEKIIQPLDAEDNGVEIYTNIFKGISPYCVSDYIFALNPTWTEKNISAQKSFETAVESAKIILKREIKKAEDGVISRKRIQEIYEKTEDKSILVLDDNYSWKKVMVTYPETLFVIKQNNDNKNWHINAVNVEGSRFTSRLNFPENWTGKEGEHLAKVTGIKDAVFCHDKRFMCVAKSKESAIALAKLAIKESSK